MSNKSNYKKNNNRRRFHKKFGGKGHTHNSQSTPKIYKHKDQLSEADVGITEFISDLEGFSGIIKARYSDFQVNEIDLEGKVAKLTDTKIPVFDKDTIGKKEREDVIESPTNFIPQETWDAIKFMVKSTEPASIELEVTNLTKEERKSIYGCVRKALGQTVTCNTVPKDDKKIMTFKKHDGKNPDNRTKEWPEDKGEYVHFIVFKESLDTMDACLRIADALHMSASNFVYAGTKDKRGKTTQWFSVRKVEPWKLIIKTKGMRDLKIGNIRFKDAPLKLGDLQGNKFRIALRNVIGADDLIERSLLNLKDVGFINYYGLQRFGNDKQVPTFSVGLNLLLGNWKEACDIILKPLESDDSDYDVAMAKKEFAATGDANKALDKFSKNKNKCVEYMLLMGLSKANENDYVNALESIPRSTRLLYIHSFQSLIWNRAVSHRIKEFGMKAVEGDLVFLGDENEPKQKDENGDDIEEPDSRKQVKVLTADDCNNYSVYDVVLPLPGFDIVYPDNLKQFYKEALEQQGLSLEMPRQSVQAYNLSGTYRKILGKVHDLSWKIMHYNEPNYTLIRSDFEEILKHKEPESLPDGKYKALVLEFSLNSSSYATMVLREILKIDTSSSAQAKLNNYHASGSKNNTQAKITISSIMEEKSEETDDNIGLLGDAEKYEAFKNLVFNGTESGVKRKVDDNEEDCQNDGKLAKIDDS